MVPDFVLLLFRVGLALTRGDSRLELPDLDVTHIARLPRMNPVSWIFPNEGAQYRGAPGTRRAYTPEELETMKELPAEGDSVQLVAHLVNASDTPAPAFEGQWEIDGRAVLRVREGALEPWKRATIELPWRWANGPHTARFVADPGNLVEEACERNNELTDRTDALALQMRVTPPLYEAFRRMPNKLGSRSFEDWVQRHVRIMNHTFAACVYPQTCPEGILERVRVDDFVLMTKEEMQANQPQTMGCDGGWNFYDDHFPDWFESHISMDFKTSVDWGLIHELTHQLGIIDLYTIVVSQHWNHVRGKDGQPLWIGYGGSQPCIMSGSGVRVLPDGSTPPPLTLKVDEDGRVTAGLGLSFAAYSEHTAGGLNALLGRRRGHFGLYLLDLPEHAFVRILDNRGEPVAAARVNVHQQTPEPGPQSIPEAPSFSGATDAKGLFALGGRPFGDINPIGLNGILCFSIEARGHAEHRFLDITQFNLSSWRGETDFVATFRTGIPPEDAPPPVHNLRFEVWDGGPGGSVVLAWDAGPGTKTLSFNVYSVFAPQYHSISFQPRYEKVATVDAGTTRVSVQPPPGYAGVTDVPCFMVTAVDADGRESGHADDRELTRFVHPNGGARIERQGAGGRLARIVLLPGATVHLRESALIGKGARLCFRFRTTSDAAASIRLSVAGLGDIGIALVGRPGQALPILCHLDGLNDGRWKDIDVDLRPLLDKNAAERSATPEQARTTWNQDWIVTSLTLGRDGGLDQDSSAAVYEFEDLRVRSAD